MRHVRDLTRARFDLVEDRARVKQRIEKLLEDALIKISSVLTDIHGVSGRAMIEALIAGLLINSEGQIETTPWAVRQIGLLLAVIDDPVVTLINMAAISKQAWLSPRLGTETARMEVQAAMHAEDGRMSSAARSLWWDIGYCIVPPPF